MTTTNGTVIDQVEGIVEAVRPTGVKVQGIWASVSQFHPVPLPDMGAHVRLEIDGKRFIRSVQVLTAAPSPTPTSSTTRDRTITRLAVLKAASNFLGLMSQAREEVRSDHVLVLADKWLAWVDQEGGDETV